MRLKDEKESVKEKEGEMREIEKEKEREWQRNRFVGPVSNTPISLLYYKPEREVPPGAFVH